MYPKKNKTRKSITPADKTSREPFFSPAIYPKLAVGNTPVIQKNGKPAKKQPHACDIEEAKEFYRKTRAGRKIKWTTGLVEELYKVVGTGYKTLYESALAEGSIDQHFILMVCKAQETMGLTGDHIDGKIGTTTIKAWGNWKTGGKHGIDYTRLLKDKKLEIGIGIGYGATSDPSKNVADYKWGELKKVLENKKYGLAITSDTKTRKTYRGKRKYKVQGDNTAPDVEIDVIIDVILPGNTDPKKSFTGFLTDKEITIYSGHARYGTGPDFDGKKSPAENFVIGVNSALHKAGRLKKGYNGEMNKVLKGKANDLERLSKAGKFDPDLYQVWFFKACSTINYLDEIRGGLVKDKRGKIKSRDNLRIMGTKEPVYPGGVSLIVEGLLEMQTMEQIMTALNQKQKDIVSDRGDTPKKDYYFAD